MKNASKRHVLLLDDSPTFRSVLASILSMKEWVVTEASDGAQAMERLAQTSPDVVVADQRMPGLTGAELYQQLRARGEQVPFVLISAAGDVFDIAATTGIEHVLQKPFDLQALESLLQQLASNSEGAG